MIKTPAEIEREILARKLNTRSRNKAKKFRKPRNFRKLVTLENLQNGRDNGGYYDSALKCVVYRIPE